jgi:hypothetical protein
MNKGGFKMAQTLAIYDGSGFIISQMKGSDLREPTGVPFLWVEIPTGKRLISINTAETPNTPVYEDIPKTDIQLLQNKAAQLEEDRSNMSEIMVDLLTWKMGQEV